MYLFYTVDSCQIEHLQYLCTLIHRLNYNVPILYLDSCRIEYLQYPLILIHRPNYNVTILDTQSKLQCTYTILQTVAELSNFSNTHVNDIVGTQNLRHWVFKKRRRRSRSRRRNSFYKIIRSLSLYLSHLDNQNLESLIAGSPTSSSTRHSKS